MNIYKERYRHSRKGFVNQKYYGQRSSAKKRGMSMPDYSKEGFTKWFWQQSNSEKLWKDYVDSNYDRWLSPSADRIDDSKSYTLDNLKLVTWKENALSYNADMKNGIDNRRNIKVKQYTIDNVFIKGFHSIGEAARITGLHRSGISRCIAGEIMTTGGYKWI